MIYLDNAATSFPRPETVYQEMDRVNRTLSVNAGRGSYKAACEASRIIFDTKKKLAELMHCTGKADVVLTPSVTQAFNQVLNGLDITSDTVVYITPYEHNAVARTMESIRRRTGCTVMVLPLQRSLELDLKKTEYLFHEKNPDIVISTVISNVTGYELPVKELFGMAKQYHAVTIADAAQAAGLINLNFEDMNADIVGFAGHKTLCGPFGIGGFILSKDVLLKCVLTGGTGSDSLNLSMPESAPDRYEAGSGNIVAIAGLHAALEWLKDNQHMEHIKELTDYLTSQLSKNLAVTVFTMKEQLGIVSFIVEGYDSGDVGRILDDEFDIAVRTGYHCAPYIHEYLKDIAHGGTIRVGIGPFNTKEDLDALLDAIESL
ncbi:aminotransferase class V-fold PLP-dependent enzyme [Enterocloster alcoholdehydrogenati]|uniref:Aminotransferase class V-fold PLP-dependent enzyme n=1 Tax=Enterocloster alcoholdehydrogenati TaxID=2547410 RepID=A0ABQ0B0S7_9FIRM